LTKSDAGESNTKYAQGGIASVWDLTKDGFEKHIADTLDAGDGLCNPDIVRMIVEEGPDRVRDLIGWGARFDLDATGHHDLGREGGHSESRILHYKDITGQEIIRALKEKVRTFPNISILED